MVNHQTDQSKCERALISFRRLVPSCVVQTHRMTSPRTRNLLPRHNNRPKIGTSTAPGRIKPSCYQCAKTIQTQIPATTIAKYSLYAAE